MIHLQSVESATPGPVVGATWESQLWNVAALGVLQRLLKRVRRMLAASNQGMQSGFEVGMIREEYRWVES